MGKGAAMIGDRLPAILFATLCATVPAKAADAVFSPSGALTSQTSVYDWTGFYVGIGGGTEILVDNISVPGVSGATIDGGDRGFFGKLTAGYDHMFSNGVVIGGAVTGRYGNVDASLSGSGGSLNLKPDYGIDVTARLGYAVTPRTIAYALGGYSYQHFKFTAPSSAFSTSWDNNGFVVGFGTETVLRNNWTWSSEYRYSNYSGKSIAALGGSSFDPVTHTFHASLNYRIGGGPSGQSRAPVVHDWTGLKIGGAVGIGGALEKVTAPVTGGGVLTFDSLASDAYLAEANIGYDREFAEKWLAGVVLAARYMDSSASITASGTTVTTKSDDFGFDALLRVGRKFNGQTLGYVIGGYSYQKMAATVSTGAASTSVGLNGATIGTGTELALNERMSTYAEYRYSAFESFSFGGATIDPSGHAVRAGVKFKLY